MIAIDTTHDAAATDSGHLISDAAAAAIDVLRQCRMSAANVTLSSSALAGHGANVGHSRPMAICRCRNGHHRRCNRRRVHRTMSISNGRARMHKIISSIGETPRRKIGYRLEGARAKYCSKYTRHICVCVCAVFFFSFTGRNGRIAEQNEQWHDRTRSHRRHTYRRMSAARVATRRWPSASRRRRAKEKSEAPRRVVQVRDGMMNANARD